MAERKLNFSAPLLSTRRMYKTAVSVRRNKTFNFTDDSETNDSSSIPVLVPVMGLDHQVTEAASVPFTWEQAPGRLKGNDFRNQVCGSTQEEVFTPGKAMDVLECPVEKAIDGNLTRLQSSKGKENGDEDDVFSDARDTLSAKDSFSVNHSISGVSGYGVAESKKPITLSEDPQSRDFMLNRFLPAAKAMTVEQPHYGSSRKPSTFMSEPTIQKRDLVPEEKRQPPKRYDESMASHYNHQYIDDEKSDEDDEVSEYADLSMRGCGMLPQLCFKESLGMLNTMPGFKAKPNYPVTSPSHDIVKSSKVSQLKSRFLSAKKLALDSVSKHKLGGEVQSLVHQSVGKKTNSASFHETRKETENLRANRLNKHIRNTSKSHELLYPKSNGSTSSISEKTVYVDTKNFPMTMSFSEEAGIAEKKPEANPDLEDKSITSGEIVKVDELRNIKSGPDRSLLAPPSPKKPSESWLLHNLSPVTSQISSRRFSFNPQKQDTIENSRNVTKWETIVKTSYMHRDHIRYSEEMVGHTSHKSKT